jgi:hypothetical protein
MNESKEESEKIAAVKAGEQRKTPANGILM